MERRSSAQPASVSLGNLLFAPARLVPPPLQRFALGRILRLQLREPIAAGDLDCLRDRHLLIRVRDLNLGWRFTLVGEELRVEPAVGNADVTISGNAEDFVLLASRRVDPDTLFFQRRLAIEGDTELGLEIKNLLDSLDPEHLLPGVDWALQRCADVLQRAG